jgi:hypothetical protein
MLARLDNLPQRHRSVTLHAAAPDVDFRPSMRCKRIPGRHDPCSRNFPSHACHAKPPAIGISLAEIAGITRSWQRPARAGSRDWQNACGNCGNPRHGPPDAATGARAGRKGRKPIFRALLRYESIPGVANGKKNGTTVVQLDSSSTVWRANGNWRTWFYGARLLREAVAKLREQSENSLSFQCGKAANPGQWCLLIPAFCVPKF